MIYQNDTERLRELLEKQYWTDEERRWLLQYLEMDGQTELQQLMHEKFEKDSAINQRNNKAEHLLSLIHRRIDKQKQGGKLFLLKNWKRVIVAASIMLLVGISVLVYLYPAAKKEQVAVVNKPRLEVDIPPGQNNAILTLSNGSAIVLNSVANGLLAQQGKTQVVKANGKISFLGKADKGSTTGFNMVTTARGNQYQLQLSDGSLVWLNATSSIRFPAAFSNKERRVEITGEAYFEIAQLSTNTGEKVPFIVEVHTSTRDAYEVQVVGTHFNINAYDDEPTIQTTLAEGKVKVVNGSQSIILQPSHQAVLQKASLRLNVQPANVEETLAWKMGMFEFHDATLSNIMRQLSRWYNVDVKFSGPVSDKLYNGSIRRQATLSQVLQILKLAGVSYSLQDRIVTVSSN